MSADAEIERGILDFDNRYQLGDLNQVLRPDLSAKNLFRLCFGQIFKYKIKQSLLLDCSNGAFSKIIIDSLGKRENIHLVETQPNGLNINLNCGALEVNDYSS